MVPAHFKSQLPQWQARPRDLRARSSPYRHCSPGPSRPSIENSTIATTVIILSTIQNTSIDSFPLPHLHCQYVYFPAFCFMLLQAQCQLLSSVSTSPHGEPRTIVHFLLLSQMCIYSQTFTASSLFSSLANTNTSSRVLLLPNQYASFPATGSYLFRNRRSPACPPPPHPSPSLPPTAAA